MEILQCVPKLSSRWNKILKLNGTVEGELKGEIPLHEENNNYWVFTACYGIRRTGNGMIVSIKQVMIVG